MDGSLRNKIKLNCPKDQKNTIGISFIMKLKSTVGILHPTYYSGDMSFANPAECNAMAKLLPEESRAEYSGRKIADGVLTISRDIDESKIPNKFILKDKRLV